jgi:hypothetical protein
MGFIVGVSLALAAGAFASWVGFDRERSFYPTVMLVIALYYVLFAAMSGSPHVIMIESAVAAVFWVLSVLGFKRSLWVVVAALALHGALDIVHPHVFINPGVPVFWPDFCSAYDFVAAGYLAVLLRRPRVQINHATAIQADVAVQL